MPQQANNLGTILHPGYRMIKQAYGASKGTHNPIEKFILYRAIVIKIIVTIDNDHTGSLFPPGTLECQILGDTVTSSNDPNIASSQVLPFNDLHNISIPEVGEEVWIVKESDKNGAIPYWIGRVNDSNFTSRVLARESYKDQSPLSRYGYNFIVEEIDEKVTHEGRSYSVPFNPGDVIQQGRSDSYIRHSYNTDDKDEGILELGIKERRRYGTPIGPSIGKTHTKTLHRVIKGSGAIFNLTDNGNFNIVEQQVLGNKLNESLSGITNSIIELTKNLKNLETNVDDIKTNLNSINNKSDMDIKVSKDDKGFVIDVELISHKKTIFVETVVEDVDKDIREAKDILNDLKGFRDNFKEHLSQGQFIN